MGETREMRRNQTLVVKGVCALLVVCLLASGCASAPMAPRMPAAAAVQREPMKIGDAPLIYEETEVTHSSRYVGGTAYVLINALPDQVLALLEQTDSFWQVLPRVLDLKAVGEEGKDRLVEIEQGTSLVSGRYTARIRTERGPAGRSSIRFWLDKTRPRALEDAYGSFEMEPYGQGKTLVTWKIRIDLGAGFAKWFFEERIRRAALTPPMRARAYVESHVQKPRVQNAGR
jgi:carbon monoxide dehydrogenase subunit G